MEISISFGNAILNPKHPATVDIPRGCGAGESDGVVSVTVVLHRRDITVAGHGALGVDIGTQDFVVAHQRSARVARVHQVECDLEVSVDRCEGDVADHFNRIHRVGRRCRGK